MRDKDYLCFTWFERDRQHVRLETPDGDEVFSLWDEDVADAIDSGALDFPRHPRPSNSDWQPYAVAYARYLGLIE